MDRQSEIQAVKRLGDQIGYGNVMDIASALWANQLHDNYGIPSESTGAFVPTVLPFMKKKERKIAVKRLMLVQSEVKSSLGQ